MSAENGGLDDVWILRVYVNGRSPASKRAVENLRKICDVHLEAAATIEVVDLADQPELAVELNIFAVPTIIRHSPTPSRKVIGDLSDLAMALDGLDIPDRPPDQE